MTKKVFNVTKVIGNYYLYNNKEFQFLSSITIKDIGINNYIAGFNRKGFKIFEAPANKLSYQKMMKKVVENLTIFKEQNSIIIVSLMSMKTAVACVRDYALNEQGRKALQEL